MKVLFVYQFSEKSTGSYMNRVQTLQNGLARSGVETTSYFLGDSGVRGPTPFFILAGNELAKAMRHADVVHAGGVGPAGICSMTKALNRRMPLLVYDAHGDALSEANMLGQCENFPKAALRFAEVAFLERMSSFECDAAIACSTPLRNLMISRGFSEMPIDVVWNGIYVENGWTYREPESKRFTISYLGGAHPWQGLDLLLEAAAYVAKQETVTIRMIGPKPDDVATIAGGRPDSCIEIVPWVRDTEELARIMRESHAFVLPRKRNRVNETAFPTKFGDFCSIGRPVISTSVGEVAAIVDKEKCGFTCEPTAQSLGEAMIKMARTEAKERIWMATNARRVAENHLDSVLIARKYLSFLNALIA